MDFAALARRAVTDGLDPHLVAPPLGRPADDDRLAIAAMALIHAQNTGEGLDLVLLATRLGIQIGEGHHPLFNGFLAAVARPSDSAHDFILLSPRCPNPRAALATILSVALLPPERPFPVPLPAGLPGTRLVAAFALDLLLPPGAVQTLRAQGLDVETIARRPARSRRPRRPTHRRALRVPSGAAPTRPQTGDRSLGNPFQRAIRTIEATHLLSLVAPGPSAFRHPRTPSHQPAAAPLQGNPRCSLRAFRGGRCRRLLRSRADRGRPPRGPLPHRNLPLLGITPA